MKHRSLPSFLALGLLLVPPSLPGVEGQTPAAPAQAAPRETPQVFPGLTELVTVDVAVTDKNGQPVTGLTADDFKIEEEGVPQAITSFQAVQLSETPPTRVAARPAVSSNLLPQQFTTRTFLILFDDLHLSPEDAGRAKDAVAAFLTKGTREGDYVSLLATSGESWWNTRMAAGREDLLAILRRLESRRLPDGRPDRLSDWEAMRIAQYNDTLVGERVYRRYQTLRLTEDAAFPTNRVDNARMTREEENDNYFRGINELMVETRAAETYRDVRDRSTKALAALERALDSLAFAKGRKALVLVSDGFILDNALDGFKNVVQAARRANVTIYFVNTRGLKGLGGLYGVEVGEPMMSRDTGAALADLTQEAAGSEHLANDTGGFVVRNTNDLEGGIQRIARESLAYYLLGYSPSQSPNDGSYRRIKVVVKGRNVNVRARKGYYAPRDGQLTPAGKREKADADLQRVLDSPYLAEDIPIRVTAYVRDEVTLGKARTLIAAEIGVKDLAMKVLEDGRSVGTLHFLLTVAHRDSSDYKREDKEVEIVMRPGTAAKPESSWYAVSREFVLEKGWYQAKLVVRDAENRRIGAVIHEFEVPRLEGLRVSTPVLSDQLQPPAPGVMPAPLVIAHRDFAAGTPLYCQIDVYGASRGEVTNQPRVNAGYALQTADGKTLASVEATSIRPTSLGFVSRLWAMGLAGIEPGSYELVITVRDEITGQEEVRREPFTVTAAASRPAAAAASSKGAP
jgi:VWFA-related protein